MTTTQPYEKDGKLWHKVLVNCSRCGGTGNHSYCEMYGTTCFKCSGHKQYWEEKRFLNEKEQARREKARERKAAKRAAEKETNQQIWKKEKDQKFLEKIGFTGPAIYIVALADTFAIKDELKLAGGHFRNEYGWYFSQPTELYPTIELTYAEGILDQENWPLETHPQATLVIRNKMAGMLPESNWFGQIGDKIEVEVTLKRYFTFDGQFGTKWNYMFEDSNHNVFKWSTSKCLFMDEGQQIGLKGTIKDHTEYRNVKQTDMTRCKIMDLVK